VPAAPAASCALCIGRTHTSNNEYTGTPGIPARNGFTAYVALSPVTGLFCHRRLRISGLSAPGRADLPSRELDASVGASGPHDFAVRSNISRQRAVDRSQVPKNPPCDPIARKTLPRPPHPVPYVRDDRETPLCVGRDSETHRDVSTCHGSEIFLQRGLDTPVNKPPDGQISGLQREQISLVSRTRCSVVPAMPTGRANARPMTGYASSGLDAPQSRQL
jgi:hypothetical protein